MMGCVANLVILLALIPAGEDLTPFQEYLIRAEKSLDARRWDDARRMIDRAAERDPKAPKVWALRTRWAEGVEDQDELIYSLHQQYRLARAQKAPRKELKALRLRLEEVDPIAPDLLDLKLVFVDKFLPIAKAYEKEGRPHSAIRIHNEILTLDPDRTESEDAIQRIASAPDPSLAESAKAKDLFADVSDEWILEFDQKHDTWPTKGKLKLENYTTLTDAGYRIMVMAGESMEQVNAFYRVFFDFGVDGGSVPHIELRIFKTQEEYLKLGSNPPEWSGGLFTGNAVETFVGSGGFDGMIRTLFHEVGHQFVGLAAPGAASTTWMNEGLATYFEGCRVLANGTVKMNMPANHYLFGLTKRMEAGWMADRDDGIDPKDPNKTPETAPRLETVIENKYRWGPAWYAPVWGVTYFFFNYQDPTDGRFLYRTKFREYTNMGGGRVGEGAVRKIEEYVLADPAKPTKSVDFSKAEPVALPRTMAELNETWKEWLIRLRDEESGRIEVNRPYLDWARYAVERGDKDQALEHFEKALVEEPENVEMLLAFAEFLADDLRNPDRASKLVRQAISVIEFSEEPDPKKIKSADRLLAKWDPKVKTLERIHEQLWSSARNLAQRYLDAGFPLMTMDVAWRFGTELGVPDIMPYFEEGVRRSGKSLWIWKLAYNEENLEGWVASGDDAFKPNGRILDSKLGEFDPDNFDYQFLTLDTVTPGDFSIEAELHAQHGKVSFCGLVFGKKGDRNCNAVILFPGGADSRYTGRSEQRSGFVDLTTFYGADAYKIWKHTAVQGSFPDWHTLRVDVSGKLVDVWFDERLVTTHEFPNMGVLRGSFGLITGKGESRFRNIRYLARSPRDPGARIEREIRMEEIRKRAEERGIASGAVDGSWLGKVPVFPQFVEWAQNPRTSWEEKGSVPQLLVFWSIQQNEMLPLHGWLSELARKHEDIGLEIVSVVSAEDKAAIGEYLASKPFPGSVCVDRYRRKGYGHVFEQYAIPDFGLPRVYLLDIDQKVTWEGDPGFRIGTTWSAGMETYIDSPIEDLAAKRKLRELKTWLVDWESTKEALHDGDIETAVPVLRKAYELDPRYCEAVKEARLRLDRIENTVKALESMALTLSRTQCEPALDTLMTWSQVLGEKIDSATSRSMRTKLKGRVGMDWRKTLDHVNRLKKSLKPGNERDALASLLGRLDPLEGTFPETFKKKLSEALDADDVDGALALLDRAETLPARWLAREFFRW